MSRHASSSSQYRDEGPGSPGVFGAGYGAAPSARGAAVGYPQNLSMEIEAENSVDYIGGNESFTRGGDNGRDSLRQMGDFLQNPTPVESNKNKKKKSKSEGGRKMPKPNINLRGSFRKVTNVFKKGGKDKQPLGPGDSRTSLEIHEQTVADSFFASDDPNTGYYPEMETTPPGSLTPKRHDPHPGGYDLNPSLTLPNTPAPGTSKPSTKTSMKDWFYGESHPAPPTYTSQADKAELRDPPPKGLVRMSTIIYFGLILLMIIGIILLAFSYRGEHYRVVGAIFLGLSAFIMVGKIFLSALFEDDPFPRLQPYWDKFQSYVGGAQDPYRLKQPTALPHNPANPYGAFMPQMTPGIEAVPLTQFTFPSTSTGPPPSYLSVAHMPGGYTAGDAYQSPSVASTASYPEKQGYHGETLDTHMGSSRSHEAFAVEYDEQENAGYRGPAAQSYT